MRFKHGFAQLFVFGNQVIRDFGLLDTRENLPKCCFARGEETVASARFHACVGNYLA